MESSGMIGEVVALGASYFGATALFGIFMWRAFAKLFDAMSQSMSDKFDHIEERLDALTREHHGLARELSEFRGEMGGRVVG